MLRPSAFIKFAFSQHSRYVVIGGGSGGLSISSHLIRSGINPWQVRIIDPSPFHYYQPGWTMIGAGLWQIKSTHQKMEETIPQGIALTKDVVTLIKPEENKIVCKSGGEFTYDELIVASGLKLQFDKVQGLREALEDPNSHVASIYQLNYAQKMARIASQLKSGKAIFTEPPMPIKCAGAPQKILYLWTQKWLEEKLPINVEFMKSIGVMFGVPKYSEALTANAKRLNINVNFKHKLIKVSGNQATFENLDTQQKVVRKFDLLHAVPPMGAHSYIANSGLADPAGYLDVNQYTLRHNKYSNIWGIGDCTSAPNAKTAAAIFSQTQALNENMMAVRKNPDIKELPGKFDGYASCPLFVGGLKLLLAEFKFGGVVDQTFYRDQEKPRYEFYFMKRFIFPLAYWYFVPRGLWAGRKGIRWV